MADRSSFMSTDSAKFADESWEEEDDVQLPRKRKTNDEPMSPVAVVRESRKVSLHGKWR